MPEYGNIDQALAGMQVGIMARIDSRIAQETIGFGAPVMGYNGVDDKCYAAHQDQSTFTIDKPLATGDSITLTINGTAFTIAYASSSDATMLAAKNAINASAPMIALGIVASLTGSSSYLTITLKAMGLDIVAVATYDAGGHSVTVTTPYSNWANFLGVSLFAQRGGRDYGAGMSASNPAASGGSAGYLIYDAVNIMNFGRVWVPISSTGNDLDNPVYLIYTPGATQNTFTTSSSGNKSTGGFLMANNTTQGLSILDVRGII
jgi:hypothetical protein